MNQKGLAPLLIVVIIALVISGILINQKKTQNNQLQPAKLTQATPMPHSSPDIKTDNQVKIYTNHLDNYSFKYPVDWQLSEIYSKLVSYTDPRIDNPDLIQVSIFPYGHTQANPFGPSITVEVSKPYPRVDQIEYLKKSQEEFNKLYNSSNSNGVGQRYYKKANTVVVGQKAIQTVERSLPGDQTDSYCQLSTSFLYGVYKYSINIQCEDKESKQYLDIYNQVLESLKLGPAQQPKPISLQTFRQERYGYSFEYPSNWLINSNDYDKYIDIIDENDRAVLGIGGGDPAGYCPPDYSYPKPDEVEFGGKKVTFVYGCNSPRFQTPSGQLFTIAGDLSNPKVKEILKSFKGLSLTQPSPLFGIRGYIQDWLQVHINMLNYYIKTQILKTQTP